MADRGGKLVDIEEYWHPRREIEAYISSRGSPDNVQVDRYEPRKDLSPNRIVSKDEVGRGLGY